MYNQSKTKKIILTTLLVLELFVGQLSAFLLLPQTAKAAFNPQMNYQGKLTNSSNVAVSDGVYHMRFYIYNAVGGATTTAIWTEDRSTATGDRITVTNGLFSVMLGSSTPLTGIDFNQTLYLGIEVGGPAGAPVWDGEMSPRKILGAVPAAFVAKNLEGGSATTTNLLVLASSTLQNFTASNSTTTNATTTNFFSGTGTFTNLFASTLNLVNLLVSGSTTLNNFTFTNATGTEATTTNLYVSNNASTTNLFANVISSGLINGQNITSTANLTGSLTLGTTFTATGGLSTLANLLLLGSSTLQNFTASNSTTTNATTTNFFSGTGTFTNLFASTLNLVNLLVSGSTTLNNFTFTNATGTEATTTNLYVSNNASTTNLFANLGNIGSLTAQEITSGLINGQTISSAANFTGTLNATGGLTTLSNLLLIGSSTLQNFTFINATGTSATTTNLYTSGETIFAGLTGNIGVGTTSPAQLLSVGGNTYITGGLGVGKVNTSAGTLETSGIAGIGSNLFLRALLNCNTAASSLQTDGSGQVSCGTITAIGGTSAGGWTWVSPNKVQLATTTDMVIIGTSSSSPYAKLFVNSGATATTTLGLAAVSGQVSNILDIYDNSTNISSVITAAGFFGLGTSTPLSRLAVSGGASVGANYNVASPTNGLIVEGRTGIGTTTPATSLGVRNSATTVAALFQGSNTGAVGIGSLNGAGFLQGYTNDSAVATANLLLNPTAGKVGIGTTTPLTNIPFNNPVSGGLEVFNDTNAGIAISSKIPDLYFYDTDASVNQRSFNIRKNGKVLFNFLNDSGSTTFTPITLDPATGFTGLGTSTPYAQTTVWGIDTLATTRAFEVVNSASTTLFSIFDNGLVSLTNLLVSGSSTLQNFTFTNATGTNATTTGAVNVGTALVVGTTFTATGGLSRLSNLLLSGSTTLQNFTFVLATGTAATTTNFYNSGSANFAVTTGQVGIGTSTPGALLTVSNTSSNTAVGSNTIFTLDNVNSLNGGVFAGMAFRRPNGNGAMFNLALIEGGDGTGGISPAGNESGFLRFATINNGLTTEKVRIAPNGNLGIGTTSPFAKLSIANVVTDTVNVPLLNISSTTGGTSTSTLFTVLANGNVGVGTNNPGQKLSVVGSVSGNETVSTFVANTGGTDNGEVSIQVGSFVSSAANSAVFGHHFKSGLSTDYGYLELFGGARALVFDNSGNVGIGTTSPATNLHVYNNANTDSMQLLVDNGNATGGSGIQINRTSNTRAAQIQFSLNNTAEWYMGELRRGGGASTAFNIGTAADTSVTPPFLTILTGGNIGIGTTTPAYKLSVEGTSTLGNQAIAGFFTGTTTSTSTFAGPVQATKLNVTGSATSTFAGSIQLINSGTCYYLSTGACLGSQGTITPRWNDIVDPNTATALNMSTFSTTFNWTTGTGANNLFNFITDSSANGTGSLILVQTGVSSTVKPLRVLSGNIEALAIHSSGNVGIGTTTPYSKAAIWGPDTLSTTRAFEVINNASTTMFSVFDNGLVTLANLQTSGSTTLQNFTFVNATGTSATTTNFFSTTGTFTNLFASTLNLTNLLVSGSTTLNNFTFVNATGTSATTTNFFSTNGTFSLFNISGSGRHMLLSTDVSGNVVSTSTPQVAAIAATSTTATSTFAGGLTAASSFNVLQNGNIGIGTISPFNKLHIKTADRLFFDGNVNGPTAISQSHAGIFLTNGAMNTNQKYTPGILFGSTDPDFTTTNPKMMASILGYASRAYSSDASAGMGLEFFTTLSTVVGGETPTPVSRMVIDDAGNVGIGTTSPQAKLEVVSTSAGATTDTIFSSNQSSASSSASRIGFRTLDASGAPTTTAAIVGVLGQNFNTATSSLRFFTQNGGTLTEQMRLTDTGLLHLSSTTLQNFTFVNATGTSATTTNLFSTNGTFTNLYSTSLFSLAGAGRNMLLSTDNTGNVVSTSTPQVDSIVATSTTATSTFAGGINVKTGKFTVLQTNGNVGINTLSPNAVFAVNGASNFNGILSLFGAGLTASNKATLTHDDNNLTIATVGGTNGHIILTPGNGNIGIGTTTPASLNGFTKTLSLGGTAPSITLMGTSGANVWELGNDSAGRFRLMRSTASVLTADTSNNVGIGTTTPNTRLTVAASGANGINLDVDTSDATQSSRLFFATSTGGFSMNANANNLTFRYGAIPGIGSGNVGMVLSASGLIGIGTGTPTAKLSLKATGTGTGRNFAVSDSNDVEKVSILDDGTARFSGIGGTSFTRNFFDGGTNAISAMFGSGSTAGFTADQYGGAIRFNGASVAWGDMSFYPNGGGNGNQGNFRLSTTGSILNTTPNGKLGVGELYSVGNVGISTTSPFAKLSITNSVTDTVNVPLLNISSTTGGTSTSTLFTVMADGKVGVGTNNPSTLFEIKDATNAPIFTINGPNASVLRGISYQANGSTQALDRYNSSTGEFRREAGQAVAFGGFQSFYTDTLERMRITSAGKIGLGFTSPNTLLHVGSSTPNSISALNYYNSAFVTGDLEVDGTFYTNNLLTLGSSTLQNFTFVNATGTQATTTNLFSTTGTFTNLFFTNATGTSATTTNFFSTNGTFTNLYSTSLFSLAGAGRHMLLSTDGSGNVVSTSTPQVAAIAATSTTATSTFAGGLTVGTSKFVVDLSTGNVGIGTTTPATKLVVANGAATILTDGSSINTPNTPLYIEKNFVNGSDNDLITFDMATASYGGSWIKNIRNSGTTYGRIGFSGDQSLVNGVALVGGSGTTPGLFVNSSNNVGIGTTTPGAKLTVSGSSSATSVGNNTIFTLDNVNSLNGGVFAGMAFRRPNGNGAMFNLALIEGGDGTGGISPAGNESGFLRFATINNGLTTEKVRIAPNGNLGIGTTSPFAKLSIANVVTDTVNVPLLNISSTTGGTSTSTLFTVMADGKVGIGTNAPDYNLTIAGTSANLVDFYRSGSQLGSLSGSNNDFGVYALAGGSGTGILRLGAAGTTWATILVNGNFGIGTTTPTSNLQVAGATPKFTISDTGAATNAKHWFIQSTGGNLNIGTTSDSLLANSSYVTILNGGNVGIGTNAPAYTLDVFGNATIKAATNAVDTFNVKYNNGNAALKVDTLANGSSHILEVHAPNNTPWIAGFYNDTYSTSVPVFEYFGYNQTSNGFVTGDFLMGNPAAKKVAIYTNGYTNPRLTVDGVGSVGIGTTSPYSKTTIWGIDTLATTRAFEVVNSASTTLFSIFDNGLASLTNLLVSGSSTLQNFTFINATGTSATTTNFFSTNFTTTNFVTTNETLTNSTTTNATSTNLAVSGAFYPNYLTKGSVTFIGDSGLLTQDNTNFFWDDSGNRLAIGGTTTPLTALHVIGASGYTSKSWAPTSGTAAIFEGGGSSRTFVSIVGDRTTQAELWLGDQDTQAMGRLRYDNSLDTLSLWSGGAQKMTIDGTTGNVGIGTTTPTSLLQVAGATPKIILSDTGAATNAKHWFTQSSGGNFNIGTTSDSLAANSTYMTIANGGNVGIGLTAPTTKLEVYGGTGEGVHFFRDSGNQGVVISHDAASSTITFRSTASAKQAVLQVDTSGLGLDIKTLTANPIGFYTNSSQKMIIDSNGNVGIGTTTPTMTYGKLSVAGGIRIADDLSAKLIIGRYGSSAAQANSYIKIGETSNSLRVTNAADDTDLFTIVNSTGFVGIGTTTPGTKLEVVNTSSGATADQLFLSNQASATSTASQLSFRAQDVTGIATTTGAITGILNKNFLAATSSIAFSTNRSGTLTEAMRIIDTGFVGIGTTTPKLFNGTVGNLVSISGSDSGLALNSTNSLGKQFALLSTFGTSAFFSIWDASAGAHRMVVDTNGNVGIATTTPAAPLNVYTGNNEVARFDSNSATGGYTDFYDRTSGTARGFIGYGTTLFNGSTAPNADSTYFGLRTAGSMAFGRSGTVDMFINTSGNVGIGTTSPGQVAGMSKYLTLSAPGAANAFGLEIAGNRTSAGEVIMRQSILNNQAEVVRLETQVGAGGTNSGHLLFYTAPGGGLAERMRITDQGNIGIGTTSPATSLNVYNGNDSATLTNFTQSISNAGLLITSDAVAGNYTPGLFWSTQNDNGTKPKAGIWPLITSQGSLLYFGTSNSYATGITNNGMVLDYSGNVGIGTTSPAAVLNVAAASNANAFLLTNSSLAGGSSGKPGYIFYNVTNFANSANSDLRISEQQTTSGTIRMVLSGGNLGLGTTTPLSNLSIVSASGGLPPTSGVVPTNSMIALKSSSNNSLYMGVDTASPFGAWLQSSDVTNLGTNYPILLNPRGGNIGIGTTSPQKKLSVIDTSAGAIVEVARLVNTSNVANSGAAIAFGLHNGANTEVTFGRIGALEIGGTAGSESGDLVFHTISAGTLAEKMRITAVGNVGIGTTSPQAKLEVVSTSAGATTDTIFSSNQSSASSSASRIGFRTFDASGAPTTTAAIVGVLGQNFNTATSSLRFFTQNGGTLTEQMRLTDTGLLHLSSTTLQNFTFVNATGTSATTTNLFSTTGTFTNLFASTLNLTNLLVSGSTTLQNFTFINATGTAATTTNLYTSGMTILAGVSGNVGIGTTSPAAKLDVRVAGGVNDDVIIDGDSLGGFIGTRYNNPFSLITNNTTKLTVSTSGSVGIATTTPGTGSAGSKLDVIGNIGLSGVFGSGLGYAGGGTAASFSTLELYNPATGNTTLNNQTFTIKLQTAGLDRLVVLNGGNVGIGTATPRVTLHVATTSTAANAEVARLTARYVGTGSGPLLRFTNGIAAGTNPNTAEYNLAGIRAYDYDSNWGGALEFQTPNTGTGGGGNLLARMTIIPGGNVGIGVTLPTANLHVSKTYVEPPGGIASTTVAIFTNNNAANATSSIAILARSSASAGINFGSELAERAGYVDYAFDVTKPTLLGLSFGTAGSARMKIDTSGNVGIGTTTPTQLLTLDGSDDKMLLIARAGTPVVYLGDTGSNNGGDLLLYSSAGAQNTVIRGGATSTFSTLGLTVGTSQFVVQQTSGNVGIGTTSPRGNLHVSSGWSGQASIDANSNLFVLEAGLSNGMTILTPSTSAGQISFGSPTDNRRGRIVYDHNTDKMQLYTAGAANVRMTIDNAGNVGIGNTSPGALLTVNGLASTSSLTISGITTATTQCMQVSSTGVVSGTGSACASPSAGGTTGSIQFKDASGAFAGNTVFVYDIATGKVGISTSTPYGALHISTSTEVQLVLSDPTASSGGKHFYASSTQGNLTFGTITDNLATLSEKMRLTSGGSLGIGTTTPGAKLAVTANGTGGDVAFQISDSSNAPALTVLGSRLVGIATGTPFAGNLTVVQTSTYSILTDTGDTGIPFATFNSSAAGHPEQLRISHNLGAVDISNRRAGNMYLQTSGGNVGIGTTSPGALLHVFNSTGNGPAAIFNKGSGIVADNNSGIRIVSPISVTHYNWMLAAQQNVNAAFEITPSTAVGGATFTAPSLTVYQTGTSSVATALWVADGNSSLPTMTFANDRTTGFYRIGSGKTAAAGTLQVQDGSQSAPSLSFTADSSMGLTRIASGVLGIVNNNRPALYINSSGQVGAGTSTPWGQLSASSTSVFPTLAVEQKSTGPVAIFTGGTVGISSTSPSTDYKLVVGGAAYFTGNVGTTGSFLGNLPFNYLTTPLQAPSINMSTFSTLMNWTTGTGANDLLRLTTDNSANGTGYALLVAPGTSSTVKPLHVLAQGNIEALAVDQLGAVGIGVVSPCYKLDVKTGTNINMNFTTGGTDVTAVSLRGLTDNCGTLIPVEFQASKFQFMNGNVGISTTTPGTALVVVGTTTAQDIAPISNLTYSLGSSTARWATSWVGTQNIGTSTWSIANGADGRLTFNNAANSAGTETVSLATNGNVGIGNTAPSFTLDVYGSQRFIGTPTTTSIFQASAMSTGWSVGNTTSGAGQLLMVDSSTVVAVSSSGIKIGKYNGTDVSWYSSYAGTNWDSTFFSSAFPNIAATMLDSSRIAIAYNFTSWGVKVVVCTLGATTVTSCGSPTAALISTGQPISVDIKKINTSGDFLVTYADSFGGTGVSARVGQTSGNTISSITAAVTVTEGGTNTSYVQIMPFSATTTKFALRYYVTGALDRLVVGTITGGTTVSFGQKEYLQTGGGASQVQYGFIPLSETNLVVFPTNASTGVFSSLVSYTSTSTIATSTIGFLISSTGNPTSAAILGPSIAAVGYGNSSGIRYRTLNISSTTITSTNSEQTTSTGVGAWMLGLSPTSFIGSNNSSVAVYRTRDMSKNYSIDTFDTTNSANILTGGTINSGLDIPLDSTRHVVVANQGSSITLKAGFRNGTSLAYGSATTISTTTGSQQNNLSGAALDTNTFVFVKGSSSGTAYAYVCTVTGPTITCGTPSLVFYDGWGGGSPIVSTAALDSTHFVVAYASSTNANSQSVNTVVASVSGTTITLGTPVIHGNNDLKLNGLNVAAITGTTTKFVVAFDNSTVNTASATNTARVLIGNVSGGTTITLGNSENVLMATSTTNIRVISPSLNTFVVFANTTVQNDMFATFGTITGQTTLATTTTVIGKVSGYTTSGYNVSLLDSTHILVQTNKDLRVVEVNTSGITYVNSIQTINTFAITNFSSVFGVYAYPAVSATSTIVLYTTTDPNTAGAILTLDNNAFYYEAKALTLKATGNEIEATPVFGVGTPNPLYTLHVSQTATGAVAGFTNGSGYCTINPTTTSLSCTSDARLKQNITSIASSTDIVRKLRGVNFSWKNDDENTNHIGFIAQEVQAIVPELVDQSPDGMLMVNYLNFAPILVNAWNALDVRVSSLEGIATSTLPATSTPMLSVTDKGLGIGTLTPNFALHAKFGGEGTAVFENNNGVCEINPSTGSFGCAPKVSDGETISTSTIGTTLASSTDIIRKLRGVNLSMMGASSTANQLGFLASDVELIAPELVASVGGIKLVRTTDLIPLLVNSIGDLAEKVDSLDARVALIEATIASSTTAVATSTASSTGVATGGTTDTNFIVNAIISAFQNMGTQISLGMAHFTSVFADNIVIGSQERPSGITLYDIATHAPFCLRIENGGQVTAPGTCADTLFPGVAETQPNNGVTITNSTSTTAGGTTVANSGTSTTTASTTASTPPADTTANSGESTTASSTASTNTNSNSNTSSTTATTNPDNTVGTSDPSTPTG